MTIEQIAKICHEANKAYCEAIGDNSQKHWEEAAEWQRQSCIKGVQFALKNPGAGPATQHKAWMDDKIAAGWVYGTEKDEVKKTHPCIVDYDKLPVEQRAKDSLFEHIVSSLSHLACVMA